MNQKVCIWCERWGSGGIESFIVNMLESMDKTGLDITVVTSQNESDVFDGRLEALGIRKKALLTEAVSSPVKRTLAVFRLFKEEMNENAYDVVHLNIYHGVALYYAKLAKDGGVAVRIAHSHNASLRPSATRPLKLAAHKIASRAFSKHSTDFCACSDLAAQWMFPKKINDTPGVKLIANGIDTGRFAFDSEKREAFRRELGIENQFAVCCVGRICIQKNQTFLTEVFAEILKVLPDSVLYLAGSEDDGGEARSKAEELGISKSVVFTGIIHWIPQLLWACDAFVLPSLFEGNPVSGIEAQATGIRCFLSDSISRDAAVTDLAEFISLKEDKRKWAERIITAYGVERKDVSGRIQAAGYDIKTSAGILRSLYLRLT